jgi:hypothetical protein
MVMVSVPKKQCNLGLVLVQFLKKINSPFGSGVRPSFDLVLAVVLPVSPQFQTLAQVNGLAQEGEATSVR